MSRSPWLEVKVVDIAPLQRLPCKVPATPPSDCISIRVGNFPNMFGRSEETSPSQYSAIGEDGVIGYIGITSDNL